MITIEDLERIDPAAAEAVADLRAAAEGHATGGGVVGRGHRAQEHQAAAVLAKRCAMLLRDDERDAAAVKQYRYVFNRGVFGVETGSTLELSYRQIMAMQEWLTGNPRRYEQVISGIIGAGESLEIQEVVEMAEHTEAKCSINARMYDQNGVDVQVTLRDGVDGDVWLELSNQWTALSDHLVKKKGWTTKASRPPQPQPAAPPPQQQAPQQGPPPPERQAQQQTQAPQQADPGWCPIHQVEMKRRQSGSDVWYSHKDGDSWCRGE